MDRSSRSERDGGVPDRGMYFILRPTQLIVRLDGRLGALRYKTAPKCLLPGPFGHSGVGGNPTGRRQGTGACGGDTLTGRKLRTDRPGPPALSGQPGWGIEYARAPHETERPLNLRRLRMGRIRSAAEPTAARRTRGDLRKLAASFPERRRSREEVRGGSARFFTGSAGTRAMRPAEGWGPPSSTRSIRSGRARKA